MPGSPFGQVALRERHRVRRDCPVEHVTVPPWAPRQTDCRARPRTDYSLVDQDPADNVTTQYEINGTGQTADAAARSPGATRSGYGTDNHLLDGFVDPALGCQSRSRCPACPARACPRPREGTDDLQAAADQQAPVALVPVNDPMTTVGADTDILPARIPHGSELPVLKTDLYRIGVDQPLLGAARLPTRPPTARG